MSTLGSVRHLRRGCSRRPPQPLTCKGHPWDLPWSAEGPGVMRGAAEIVPEPACALLCSVEMLHGKQTRWSGKKKALLGAVCRPQLPGKHLPVSHHCLSVTSWL